MKYLWLVLLTVSIFGLASCSSQSEEGAISASDSAPETSQDTNTSSAAEDNNDATQQVPLNFRLACDVLKESLNGNAGDFIFNATKSQERPIEGLVPEYPPASQLLLVINDIRKLSEWMKNERDEDASEYVILLMSQGLDFEQATDQVLEINRELMRSPAKKYAEVLSSKELGGRPPISFDEITNRLTDACNL